MNSGCVKDPASWFRYHGTRLGQELNKRFAIGAYQGPVMIWRISDSAIPEWAQHLFTRFGIAYITVRAGGECNYLVFLTHTMEKFAEAEITS